MGGPVRPGIDPIRHGTLVPQTKLAVPCQPMGSGADPGTSCCSLGPCQACPRMISPIGWGKHGPPTFYFDPLHPAASTLVRLLLCTWQCRLLHAQLLPHHLLLCSWLRLYHLLHHWACQPVVLCLDHTVHDTVLYVPYQTSPLAKISIVLDYTVSDKLIVSYFGLTHW